MNIFTLRNFIAIAQCGSFTKAADQLLVSQPTLSRQIRELEEELDIRLFQRDKAGLRITEAGELLMEEATAIVDRCDGLYALFHPDADDIGTKKIHDVLRVGYQPFIDSESIYRTISDLRRSEPDAEVLLTEDDIPKLRNGLISNRFDAVFCLQVYFEDIPGVRTLLFQGNRFQLVVSADHPLAGRDKVRISELRDESFILLRREFSPIVVDQVISLCVKNGFSPHASHYVSSAEEGLKLAAAGEGISFSHSQMNMEGLEERFQVRFLDLDEAEADLPLAFAYKERNSKPTLRCLIQTLNTK